jgi:predicted TIM-barrel enzyme
MAGGANFIRAENFVFAHVADEGFMPDADAGPLLRYRREIGAEHVRIFADIKKKHSSHALTADVALAETARAAALFRADGLVVTGVATGEPVLIEDAREIRAATDLPVAVGSGLTPANLPDLWDLADIFIVGSFLKFDNQWHQPPDPERVEVMMSAARQLR